MTKCVAFLKGINVGGNTMVKMSYLKQTLESAGFQGVTTLLNSGNVIFETDKTDVEKLTIQIESLLEKTVGRHISVMLRTGEKIKQLVATNPFAHISVTPQTRLYVTFLAEKPKSNLPIPYTSPEKDFTILSVSDREVCSALTLLPNKGTPEAMNILGREFGKEITTRNWNTIEKIAKKLS